MLGSMNRLDWRPSLADAPTSGGCVTDGPDTVFDMKADLETLSSLAKRRGFAYPSADIYGGFQSTWDYGPLGVEMKRQIRELWWRWVVQSRDDVVGIEAAIITNPAVWRASGHVENFTDPLVDCLECHSRMRADHIENNVCPSCGAIGRFTEERRFNLLFRTYVGPVEEDASVAYLRPETAQGMFVNFDNVLTTTRRRLPVGIAQIGKSFRNEITPGQFIFRTREFEQMEMEFFCHPGESREWYQFWRDRRFQWYVDLGIKRERLILRDHEQDELSHYSVGTADVEYAFPFCEEGEYGELEGIAHRGDFDLRSHMEGKLVRDGDQLVVEQGEDGKPKYPGSGKDLTYHDEEAKERFVPHVIEPAAGADRTVLAFICDAYDEEEITNEKGKTETRVVMRFHPRIAPVKVGVFPLLKNKPELVAKAMEVRALLQPYMTVFYDETGAIGRRYRRQDEVGTPFGVTIDFDTIGENGDETKDTVTLRERDSMEQRRVKIEDLLGILLEEIM